MTITQVSSKSLVQWLSSNRFKHSVLMIKQDDCIPCGRAMPMYCSLANKYASIVQFGIHTIEPDAYDFVHSTLGVMSTPTFLVYTDDKIEFRLASVKRFPELKRYVEQLYPTI